MNAVCIQCQSLFAIESMRYLCDCGGLLEITHNYDGLDAEYLKPLFASRLSERNSIYASGVWRYKELIAPEIPDHAIVSKNEGNTGLYETIQTTQYAGIRRLWLKAQSENPSGSFKDNGMTAAVSHARYLGCSRLACTSTGNTSSSLSMYAAIAGLDAVVLVPNSDISPNKVLQTLAYGADVCSFSGTYDDGIRFLEEHANRLGLYVCNSINPMRIEGQKSIIFEIAQDLGWVLPDWIIVPGGALSNASALGKGLQDLYTLGFIEKLPQVAVVQAEGAQSFHRMIEAASGNKCPAAGAASMPFVPEPNPQTRASALNIGSPPSWPKAWRMLSQTNGVSVTVSDAEILEAKAVIDRSGIGCEPASAAALAGLRKLVSQGVIHREQTAAGILTGHLLKDTEAIKEYHQDGRWGDLLRNEVRTIHLQTAGSI
ncbi:threonine synthase [Paenibacillus oenotherae]|uniref:Threonine synthase n=1 Tax=Paenibacillus oenotherae TaxID=1435645 RepID=A0ABS7D5J7_9BACL|nr:threonine synthase [Paenibacillus oenotherae]MBW7475188.1 threonine synthase [Paenibacillus oenotherae]